MIKATFHSFFGKGLDNGRYSFELRKILSEGATITIVSIQKIFNVQAKFKCECSKLDHSLFKTKFLKLQYTLDYIFCVEHSH